MEQEIVHHDLFHEHPLSRIPTAEIHNLTNDCYGCCRYFLGGEAVYGCSLKCGFPHMLHQECMEMPREIRHPLHPSHTLTLQLSHETGNACAVCEDDLGGMMYKCSRGCEVKIDMRCAGSFEIVAADEDAKMKHQSHPQHLLKKTRSCSCSFRCDACGVADAKALNSYICTVCDYWIHEKCALLPPSALFPSHHHSLSLSFDPPYEYIRCNFNCAICGGHFPLRRWVYHCYLCKYIVHTNCATKAPPTPIEKKSIEEKKGIIKSPIDDIYVEIIRGFVKRERRNCSHLL